MKYIILYAHDCGACSKVARVVQESSIPGLTARALEDSHVGDLLSKAGLQAPGRPALLILGDAEISLVTGWAMRRRLARAVGWRRSGAIVRLLTAEWRARLARSAAPHSLSRRGVIGTLAAGVIGWILPSDAMQAPRGPKAARLRMADPDDVTKLLRTASAQQAIRTWGPAQAEVFEVTGSQPVLVLTHSRGILTFVDNSAGALRDIRPVALSIAPSLAEASGATMRYYSIDGVPLADIAANGRVTLSSAQSRTSITEPDIRIPTAQLTCFVACLGSAVDGNCANNCVGCAHSLMSCVSCAACAGPKGVACARQCFGKGD